MSSIPVCVRLLTFGRRVCTHVSYTRSHLSNVMCTRFHVVRSSVAPACTENRLRSTCTRGTSIVNRLGSLLNLRRFALKRSNLYTRKYISPPFDPAPRPEPTSRSGAISRAQQYNALGGSKKRGLIGRGMIDTNGASSPKLC